MVQRGEQFPGYIIREIMDAPWNYNRYLAQDSSTGQWVIIRSLNRELNHTIELRLGYQDACRKYATAKADGIIPILEMGTSYTTGVYAVYPYRFSYLTFGEISSLIQKRSIEVGLTFYASILLDAVRILESIYPQKIEHYSILPSSVTVNQFGDVCVVDFVDAIMRRRFHFQTELSEKFDAPEWRRHENVGVESDIYAISALLYQSITGQFQPDEWEPRWMGMMDELDRAGIPGDSLGKLTEFFQKSLAERPQQRFQSYDQLAIALEQIVSACGEYVPREIRADILKHEFDEYPPNGLEDHTLDSDVINLISDVQSVVEVPCEDENRGMDVDESNKDRNYRIALDETLTIPMDSVHETKVVYKNIGNFRTINPSLRPGITASPLEILSRSRYQILDQLGTGGTGTVYKVLDTTLAEVLALKVLRPELVSDSAWLQRFKRELKITRDLEHAYILPAYHLEQLEGLYFFTMRYVDGKNLSEMIAEKEDLSLGLRLRILMQIAEGLVSAHDKGIIHRDLKPANIMIESESYHPYLMDFGIASAPDTQSLTVIGQGIGTPSYMAPEQSRGEHISTLADIYSYGILAYECLTYKLPFTGATAVSIYNAQQSNIFEPVRDINPNVPSSVADIISQCMQPELSKRPSSIRVIVDVFRSVLR